MPYSVETWLTNNPWVTLMGLILAVIGIAIAILFYYKGKKTKQLSYTVKNNILISDWVSQIEKLEVRHDGSPIEDLASAFVTLQNSGTDAIRSIDIADTDPILITLTEDCKILAAKITNVSHKATNPSISINDYTLEVDFNHLNRGNTFTIDIYYTGKASTDISVKGTIIGGGEIIPTTTSDYVHFAMKNLLRDIALTMTPIIVITLYSTINILEYNELTYIKGISNLCYAEMFFVPVIFFALFLSVIYVIVYFLLRKKATIARFIANIILMFKRNP